MRTSVATGERHGDHRVGVGRQRLLRRPQSARSRANADTRAGTSRSSSRPETEFPLSRARTRRRRCRCRPGARVPRARRREKPSWVRRRKRRRTCPRRSRRPRRSADSSRCTEASWTWRRPFGPESRVDVEARLPDGLSQQVELERTPDGGVDDRDLVGCDPSSSTAAITTARSRRASTDSGERGAPPMIIGIRSPSRRLNSRAMRPGSVSDRRSAASPTRSTHPPAAGPPRDRTPCAFRA